jgi:hypothetical protein
VKYTSLFLLLMIALAAPVAAQTAPEAPAPAAAAVPRQEEAVPPAPAEDARLGKALAVQVRSAPLADVLAHASAAGGVSMAASGPAGDQRITLHAARTTVGELQGALRDLLRLRVSRRGEGDAERYTLSADPRFTAQAEGWRRRQADAFVQALLRTSQGYISGRVTETVTGVRERFLRQHPEFTEEMLAPVDEDYLRQSLLLLPLTPTLRGQLVQSSWLSLPVGWLSPPHQALLAAFARGGPGAFNEELLFSGAVAPRVQYRLLYGDRWTDQMLLVQVGHSGAWTTAMLPSILFRQRDDSALYPEVIVRPDDPDVWRRLPPRFETAGRDWDTVLADLADRMKIKLAADSYARPWLFNTDRPLPPLGGIPLRDALDRLCRERGCFWWKQNDWYLLRSRTWTEESRVAVPDRLLRGWAASVRASDDDSPEGAGLTAQDLFQLATLTDEQLLTLDVQSRPPGSIDFLGGGFDPDEAALMTSGLLLFRSLAPAQRVIARTGYLPALWLPPAQQNLFAAVAAQHGAPLVPEYAESWGFRLRQSFGSQGDQGARRVSGSVTVEWRFGPGQVARASVALGDRVLHQTVEPANPSDVR